MHPEDIPAGYCQCGCGQTTRIATKTVTQRGLIRGEPLRFVNGHNQAIPAYLRVRETDPRTCTCCGETKQAKDFTPRSSKGGYQSECKVCKATYARERWRNAPRVAELQRDYRLRRKYGITSEKYEEMLAAQGNACAACKRVQKWAQSDRLHVDHCHATGRIRGLLCHKRNAALGLAEDSVARLRELITYLETQ